MRDGGGPGGGAYCSSSMVTSVVEDVVVEGPEGEGPPTVGDNVILDGRA
jgi:hypothetical protein